MKASGRLVLTWRSDLAPYGKSTTSGNIWDVADPLGEAIDLGGAEVFRHRPSLEIDRGTELITRGWHASRVVSRAVLHPFDAEEDGIDHDLGSARHDARR